MSFSDLFYGFLCFIYPSDYPDVQTKNRIRILFDYPIKNTERGFELDAERLDGKLLGISCVDSGQQIIIDPRDARISEKHGGSEYCRIKVPDGEYLCRFINKGYALSIRKAG